MRVLFMPGAQAQLENIRAHIARDNPKAARAVIARIEAVATFLGENPGAGRKLSRGRLQRFPVRPFPYLIYYKVSRETMQIVRIRHAAQFRKAFHEAASEFRR